MHKIRNLLTGLFAITSIISTAHAETLDANKLYLGAGLSWNDYDGISDNAFGYQIFAGLPIPVNLGTTTLSGEVGYMNAGEPGNSKAEADGVWANAVFDIPLQSSVSLLARIGLDFGDDDGLMFGGGIAIPLDEKIDLRFEYVIRDHINSLQANLKFDIF